MVRGGSSPLGRTGKAPLLQGFFCSGWLVASLRCYAAPRSCGSKRSLGDVKRRDDADPAAPATASSRQRATTSPGSTPAGSRSPPHRPKPRCETPTEIEQDPACERRLAGGERLERVEAQPQQLAVAERSRARSTAAAIEERDLVERRGRIDGDRRAGARTELDPPDRQ